MGSQLALAAALQALGKHVTCLFAQEIPAESPLACLPGFDGIIPAASFEGTADTFIAVDVSDQKRMGDAGELFTGADLRIIIDHHEVDTCASEFNYVEPDAAATSLLIWELVGVLGVERDEVIASCTYAGLMTDTGRFQFQNTDARAFEAAAQMVRAGACVRRMRPTLPASRGCMGEAVTSPHPALPSMIRWMRRAKRSLRRSVEN